MSCYRSKKHMFEMQYVYYQRTREADVHGNLDKLLEKNCI